MCLKVATPLPQLDLWRGSYVLLTTSADSYYVFKKYLLAVDGLSHNGLSPLWILLQLSTCMFCLWVHPKDSSNTADATASKLAPSWTTVTWSCRILHIFVPNDAYASELGEMTLLDLVKDSRMLESQEEWWKRFASIADKHPYNIPLEMCQQGHKVNQCLNKLLILGC